MKGDYEDAKINNSKKSTPRAIENEVFLSMVRERDRLWYKEGKYREFLINRYKNG